MNLDINENIDLVRLKEVLNQELKIPLTSMAFNIQTLKRLFNEGPHYSHQLIREKIETIESAALHMGQKIEHLLYLVNLQLTGQQIRMNLVHTHDLLSDFIAFSKKINSSYAVEIDASSENEYCTIGCDKDKLLHAFYHIVDTLMIAGKPIVCIKLSTKIIGKLASIKICSEYFTENIDDLGFGLALSKTLIEGHKGTIKTESTRKTGTTFIVELPRMNLEDLKRSHSFVP